MKSLGIIQPGKLGDLIICLPIAEYYNSIGVKVTWPIFHQYVSMFSEAAPYVNFLPVTDDVYNCVPQAKGTLINYKVDNVFDLAATFPGSSVTDEYVKEGDGFGPEKFDEFKYRKANVPFYRKWTLNYNRNIDKENEIYDLYVKQEKYDFVGIKHSRGQLNVKFESKNQIIEVNDKHSIFYWRKIIEKANCIALVDSAMANFVEQLNIPNKKILLRKERHPTPTFKSNWIIK